ncbi:sugar transporter [Sanghuangporus baumii]|uniref:Sugar transporter n=1 Tax=Sanghuangporus baumii TaxID=108892 RepID=A0A9Q5HQ57_SANBA|nr:sugar transporter [Sanghuangporus baumii]
MALRIEAMEQKTISINKAQSFISHLCRAIIQAVQDCPIRHGNRRSFSEQSVLAFVAYWGIVLFGYDTGVAGSVIAQDYFKQHFLANPDGTVDSHKATSLSANVVSAGAFFGALGSAPISAGIGRKYTLFGFSVIFIIGAILQVISGVGGRGISYIYAGRAIAGVGVGAISAVAPTYVSECSPKDVRGRVTGLFQIMVAVGVMLRSVTILYNVVQEMINNLFAASQATSSTSGLVNTTPSVRKCGKFPSVSKLYQVLYSFPVDVTLIVQYNSLTGGIMCIGLLFVRESPRWLASCGRKSEAMENLSYIRKLPIENHSVLSEMAEIEAAVQEEREARKDLGMKEAFLGKGNFIRFVIAFVIFLLQQWAGQNSVGYYAPQIFQAIGYEGASNSLLASGIYGIVKVIATTLFVFFLVESLGRKLSLAISAFGMGTLFFIIGAILKTHPPGDLPDGATAPPASKAMAAMLYIYVAFYSMGWGPLPWVYVSDIFPTRTRHYGLSVASASQWLWNFVVSYTTPRIIASLGYKIFLMFAAVNIGAMFTFSLFIPETKGRSLEEMDVIFGAIGAEEHAARIRDQEKAIEHDLHDVHSSSGDEHNGKGSDI